MPRNIISEDDIKQALLQRLQHLHGFDTLNCSSADPAIARLAGKPFPQTYPGSTSRR